MKKKIGSREEMWGWGRKKKMKKKWKIWKLCKKCHQKCHQLLSQNVTNFFKGGVEVDVKVDAKLMSKLMSFWCAHFWEFEIFQKKMKNDLPDGRPKLVWARQKKIKSDSVMDDNAVRNEKKNFGSREEMWGWGWKKNEKKWKIWKLCKKCHQKCHQNVTNFFHKHQLFRGWCRSWCQSWCRVDVKVHVILMCTFLRIWDFWKKIKKIMCHLADQNWFGLDKKK